MKKIILMLIVMMLLLTGCSKNTAKSVVLDATVVSCEEGNYHRNASYSSIANMYLVNGNYAQYNIYSALANATGYYDYNITFSIGDEYQIVVRNEKYEVGSTIYVEKIYIYNESDELIKIIYK